MKPALFQAMMNVLPSILLEYPKNNGTSLKFQSFVSKCSAMADLNYTMLELGDSAPQPSVLIHKNWSLLSHVLQHMAFILMTNSSSLTETMPAKYLSKLSTDLMFRFDTKGLEVNDLEDPPELAELHYVAFKRVYVHNLDIVRRELFRVVDDNLKAYRPTFKDIQSSPGTAWNNIFKRTILRISKEGVWGSWKELPANKNGPYLASEFLYYGHFLLVSSMKCQ